MNALKLQFTDFVHTICINNSTYINWQEWDGIGEKDVGVGPWNPFSLQNYNTDKPLTHGRAFYIGLTVANDQQFLSGDPPNWMSGFLIAQVSQFCVQCCGKNK